MEQSRTLEHGSGAVSGTASAFNPNQECYAVHPTNGEKCTCLGLHIQHWAIYSGENGRTIFSSWVGGTNTPPRIITNGRVYPAWKKSLVKLAAVAITGLVIWLAFWLLSELGG